MGDWNINIKGIGCHNNTENNVPSDADKMAAQFVQALKNAGHSIQSATFVAGGSTDIFKPN